MPPVEAGMGYRSLHAGSGPFPVEAPKSRAPSTAMLAGGEQVQLLFQQRTVASSEMHGWELARSHSEALIQGQLRKQKHRGTSFQKDSLNLIYRHLSGRVQKRQRDYLESDLPQLISQSILKWLATSVSAY